MRVGIDFGSTYSTVSSFNETTNQVEALTLIEGEPASIPSVVSIDKKGRITCGKGAKDQIGKKSVRIFQSYKMLLTEANQSMLKKRGYDDQYTPQLITKHFLESTLKGVMKRYASTEAALEEVVVCVPEIWGTNIRTLDGRGILRETLMKDIELPVNKVRVVTEPEAASAFFAYDYEKTTGNNYNGYLLLIDYGGGTLDITLTEVTSSGNGTMEIGYREGGGAGENHSDEYGNGTIGCAGIAFQQRVVALALKDAGVIHGFEEIDFASPAFAETAHDLESLLKSPDRIEDIENTFGEYGSGYEELREIMLDEPREFISLEYDEEEVPVTYQHLYQAYHEIIEDELRTQIKTMNEKVAEHIGMNPCEPAAGSRNNFMIALVGGFGAFYLVKKQLYEMYNIDPNVRNDLRIKYINTEKQEQAISLGAALLASHKVVLQKTARYSIGLYTADADRNYKLHYGIKYHQTVETDKPYFIRFNDDDEDIPENRIPFGALYGNITHFAIEFTELTNRGGLMALKSEELDKLARNLPTEGLWNLGFSLDESDIVTFHIVEREIPGFSRKGRSIPIQLASYTRMFDVTAVKEVIT